MTSYEEIKDLNRRCELFLSWIREQKKLENKLDEQNKVKETKTGGDSDGS